MLDAESAALRDYLVLLSDLQFDGAWHGLLLSRATFSDPYTSAFTREADQARVGPTGSTQSLFPHAIFPHSTFSHATFPQDALPDATFSHEALSCTIFPQGGAFGSHEARRLTYWQPSAPAPASLQIAWLLDSFAEDVFGFAEARLELLELTVHDAGHADISLRHQEVSQTPYTIRVRIDDRTEPLDFPATYIRDIFEGRHRTLSTGIADGPRLLDLRSML